MKLSFSSLGLLLCFVTLVAAWSKEDQEIFRLRNEVAATEGPDVTFYDFLGIKQSASQEDINKAYKKKSRTLHPDKVKQQFIADKTTGKGKSKSKKPGVHVSKGPSQSEIKAAAKAASDRFARLGLVAAILRGPGRERYDHFLNNGFPKWKGTGYYYARFRPGLGTVLTGLFIFVGGAGHYLALYMSWKRQQEFVGRYIKFARHAAWGENLGIPGLDGPAGVATPPVTDSDAEGMQQQQQQQPMNRRQRRLQEKDSKKEKAEKKPRGAKAAKASPAETPPAGATGRKKRVVAENGKILVVDAVGNVYLEQVDADGEAHEFLLDPNELPKPTIRDTALYRAPIWAYNLTLSRFLSASPNAAKNTPSASSASSSSAASSDNENEKQPLMASTSTSTSTPAAKTGSQESDPVAAGGVVADGGDDDDDVDVDDDFELLEKEVKTTAPNGVITGKVTRRNNNRKGR